MLIPTSFDHISGPCQGRLSVEVERLLLLVVVVVLRVGNRDRVKPKVDLANMELGTKEWGLGSWGGGWAFNIISLSY